MTTPFHRPAPILACEGAPIDRRTHFRKGARRLLAGETLWVKDRYKTGLGILQFLVRELRPPAESADHAAKQAYREAYRDHAWRLLVPVEGGRVALPGAPEIGFLSELYPELERFWLPLAEVRDLSHAWHRYSQGVEMPVLGHRLHPFYGTYLPKRTAHLELFATWLSAWSGARERAIDVGTGSGVLALMLARAGFSEVVATDLNPNACESVRRELGRRPAGVRVLEGDLIVFNPPWTRGPVENLLDRALSYDDDLFERFFDQAHARLREGGRVVLVFSNVPRLVQPDEPHPFDEELSRGRFSLVAKQTRRVRPRPGERTREKVEVWELAPV